MASPSPAEGDDPHTLTESTHSPLSSSSKSAYFAPTLLRAVLAILQNGQYVFEKTTTGLALTCSSTNSFAILTAARETESHHSIGNWKLGSDLVQSVLVYQDLSWRSCRPFSEPLTEREAAGSRGGGSPVES